MQNRPAPLVSQKLVRAQSPHDVNETILLLRSDETWKNAQEEGDIDKLAQYLGLVQTGMHAVRDQGLLSAVACFQGLTRPLQRAYKDESIYAYITNPRSDYAIRPNVTRTAWDLVEVPRTDGAVFMILVEIPDDPTDPVLQRWQEIGETKEVSGLIQSWEWTRPDPLRWEPQGHKLPARSRFKHQHW